jgi:hypothetical protein
MESYILLSYANTLTTNHYSDGKAHTNKESVTGPLQSPAPFGEMWELQSYPTHCTKIANSFVHVEIRNGKRQLGRLRLRWDDNIKLDFQEVGCGGMDWIKVAQVRDRCWTLVNVVMNFWVP